MGVGCQDVVRRGGALYQSPTPVVAPDFSLSEVIHSFNQLFYIFLFVIELLHHDLLPLEQGGSTRQAVVMVYNKRCMCVYMYVCRGVQRKSKGKGETEVGGEY